MDFHKGSGKLSITGKHKQVSEALEKVAAFLEENQKTERHISIPVNMVGVVLGKGGSTIKQLQESSGANLSMDKNGSMLKVEGTKKQVELAEQAVEEVLVKNRIVDEALPLSPKSVAVFTANSACVIRDIQKSSGANIDLDRKNSTVRVHGLEANVTKAGQALVAMMKDIDEKYIREIVSIQRFHVPVIVGRSGATIKELQSDSGAVLEVDKINFQVIIMGLPESVAKAKAKVDELLASEEWTAPSNPWGN